MTTTNTYSVTGMTCAHCVSAVTGEVGAGGTSSVRVTSESPLDPDAVRTAVDEAGYVAVAP